MSEVDHKAATRATLLGDAFQYRADIYGWSKCQAAALRELARRRGLPNDLDVEHVIEEIERVGGSQLAAVESLLRLIFVHLMKAACAETDEPKLHWRSEVIGFHNELVSRFTSTMEKDIDLDRVWARAFRQARAALQEYGEEISPSLRLGCPFELQDLTVEDLDPDELSAVVIRLVSRLGERP